MSVSKNPKIAIVAPIYDYFPSIIASMKLQIYQNWELYLMHDGPLALVKNGQLIKDQVLAAADPRVILGASQERRQNFGHPLRRDWLNELKFSVTSKDAEFVVITNADNYHTPAFLLSLLMPFTHDGRYVASYCSEMSHNYFGYVSKPTKLEITHIDIACLMFRKDAACEIGWNGDEHAADWAFIRDMIAKYGEARFAKVQGNHLVHN